MTFDEARKLEPGTPLKLSELGVSRGFAHRYFGRGPGAEVASITRLGFVVVLREGNKNPSTYHPGFWDRANALPQLTENPNAE